MTNIPTCEGQRRGGVTGGHGTTAGGYPSTSLLQSGSEERRRVIKEEIKFGNSLLRGEEEKSKDRVICGSRERRRVKVWKSLVQRRGGEEEKRKDVVIYGPRERRRCGNLWVRGEEKSKSVVICGPGERKRVKVL